MVDADPSTMSAQAAAAEIENIRSAAAGDPKHAYRDSKHPAHKALHQRVFKLHAVVTPGVIDDVG